MSEEIREVKKLERQIKIKKLKKELKDLEAEEEWNTYFHETESISQGFAYESSIASYQYNCSKIKNSIY